MHWCSRGLNERSHVVVSSGEGQVFDQAAFAPAPPTSFHIICPLLTQYLAMMANKDDIYDTG